VPVTDFALRILLAMVLGSVIGLEREWRQRMAGLRTNALVSLGACLFVLLSVVLDGDSSPSRIASQVVSGLGFLGGGVILREGMNIKGLTTAATLWCTGAVGVLAGWGHFGIAAAGAAGVLTVNIILRPLQKHIQDDYAKNHSIKAPYYISVYCARSEEQAIRDRILSFVQDHPLTLLALYSEDTSVVHTGVVIRADLLLRRKNFFLVEQLTGEIRREHKVTSVSWNYMLDHM